MYEHNNKIILIMEFINGGNLKKKIKSNLSIAETKKIFTDILTTM